VRALPAARLYPEQDDEGADKQEGHHRHRSDPDDIEIHDLDLIDSIKIAQAIPMLDSMITIASRCPIGLSART
jgi:hypothetical protein